MWLVLLLFVALSFGATWFQGPCSSDEIIKKREGGYQPRVYVLSQVPHICYGFNLKKTGARAQLASLGYDYDRVIAGSVSIDQPDCQVLLDDDMATATQCATSYVNNYNALSAARKSVLVDMAYNLGCAGLGEFTKLRAAVESSSWTTASSEIKNSNYCAQVGCRCTVNRICMDPCSASAASCTASLPTGAMRVTLCETPAPPVTPRPTPAPTPAPVVPCAFTAWSGASSCSGPCGVTTGTRTRTRTITSGPASCGPLTTSEYCSTPQCPCIWSAWRSTGPCGAACDTTSKSLPQSRFDQGGVCPDESRTTDCTGVSCPCQYSAWVNSAPCKAAPGVTSNSQQQTRYVVSGSNCNEPLFQTVSCTGSVVPCTSYSEWSKTTATCPGACGSTSTIIETRVKAPAGCQDTEGATRAIACTTPACPPAACTFSQWSRTGECNPMTCLATETRTRLSGTCAGALQQAVACACPSSCVWQKWSAWGPCNVCTGKGETTRTRTIATPAVNGGLPCSGGPSETMSCDGSCDTNCANGPVPCEFNSWSEWSECAPSARKRAAAEEQPIGGDSADDGQLCSVPGLATRTRSIKSAARCDAPACSTLPLVENQICDAIDRCSTPIGGDAPSEPGQNPIGDTLAVSSSGALSTGAIIGIAVGGALCLLLLLAALLALLYAARSGNMRQSPVAHSPTKDNVVEQNPLFYGQSQKTYNPIFYGQPGAGGSGGAAIPMVPATAAGAAYPSGGAYPTGAGGTLTYGIGGAGVVAGAAGGPMGYAGGSAPVCVICGQSYPTQADVDHHVQKRHAGTVGSDALYPSQNQPYNGNSMPYGTSSARASHLPGMESARASY